MNLINATLLLVYFLNMSKFYAFVSRVYIYVFYDFTIFHIVLYDYFIGVNMCACHLRVFLNKLTYLFLKVVRQ